MLIDDGTSPGSEAGKGKSMATENRHAVNAGQIRERIEAWATALRAKDVEGVMSHYAPEVLVFDLPPPLRYVGADVYRRSWEEWFATFEGPVGYEIRDLSITTGGDVAFCHSVNRISGKRTNGEETDVWVRATVGYRRIDAKWMVTHEHVSVPFYMDGSDRAAIDLKP
jgi:ketosteroid isomerase-like protein